MGEDYRKDDWSDDDDDGGGDDSSDDGEDGEDDGEDDSSDDDGEDCGDDGEDDSSDDDGEDAESCNMANTQTSPNLECLTLGNYEQLFQLQGGYFISRLEKVKLEHLISLQDIWKGPMQVATDLKELELYQCNNLTYIFPVMLIEHLPQLSTLKIKSCEKLKQIIAGDDTLASSSSSSQVPRSEKNMAFHHLKTIVLGNLPMLESFSPLGYQLEFPCLELLEVKQYLKMITSFTVDYLTLIVHAKTVQASHLDEASPSQEDIVWRRRTPTNGLPQHVMIKRFHQ